MATYGNQTTFLNTLTLPEMTDLVKRTWIFENEMFPRVARQLYIERPIADGQGKYIRFNELDMDTFANEKPEGAKSKKSTTAVGYQKDLEVKTYSKEIDITLEMRQDNEYPAVASKITSLAHYCPERLELDLTLRFSYATSTSYTSLDGSTVPTSMGDDFALLYSAHTLSHSSTTYRNRVSGDPVFSQGSYEAALLLLNTQTYNNLGENRTVTPNAIVTSNDPSTVREVKQLLSSTADVDGAHSGITNVYNGAVRHIILDRLGYSSTGAYDSTKRRWWFVGAFNKGGQGLQAYLGMRKEATFLSPSDSNNGMDIHTYNWTYSTYSRWGSIIVSGRCIAGSCPTS